MPKKIVEAKVVGQRVLNSSTKLIEVYAPELAELAVPGQFVNVQVFNRTACCAVRSAWQPLTKMTAPLP